MALSTIIIPVSGDSSHIKNVIEIEHSVLQYSDALSMIIIFDQKGSTQSVINYDTLTRNVNQNTKIIAGKFESVGDARNAALPKITTPWFSFCDADDRLILENYLSAIKDAEKIDADLVLASYIVTETGKEPQKFLQIEDSLDWKSTARNPGIWRYLFKTTTFSHVRFPSLNMAEDQIYLSRIYSVNPKLKISALPVYNYIKQETGSLTSTPTEVKRITAAVDVSLKLEYSKVRTYSRIQRAYLVTQILTSIKTVSLLRKPYYLHKLLLHSFHGSISEILSSLNFLSYCFWRKT